MPSAKDLQQALLTTLKRHKKTRQSASLTDWYVAVAETARERLLGLWEESQKARNMAGIKTAHYLSIEYLPGPHTWASLHGASIHDAMCEALENLGQNPKEVFGHEPDPGLGNGGLGRLASCFADSAACLHLPVVFYGLFYRDGFFRQHINGDGRQEALPDKWLIDGVNPWGVVREDRRYTVKFHGWQNDRFEWVDAIEIPGIAHDIMIPAYDGKGVNTKRLWNVASDAKISGSEFGEIAGFINDRLYPSDKDERGKKLRLMQEYFLVSCSLQDIIARHLDNHPSLDNLAEFVAIQINDTHPALAVPELMRLLVDEHGMDWKKACEIVRTACAYTNHTLLPEALERWHTGLFQYVLPRHYGIIQGLQADLMNEVETKMACRPQQEKWDVQARVSLVHEGHIRMGHVAAFCTRQTNGVSKMHSELMAKTLFPDLRALRGEDAIVNHTNGITPRGWLLEPNPELAILITETLGHENWISDLPQISSGLWGPRSDPDFRNRFRDIKRANKQRLADFVKQLGGPQVSPDAFFDIHVKRFHEYKRQLLNALHVVALYQDIIQNPGQPRPDTVKIFAGKAADSYDAAKDCLALVNFLAKKINNDPQIGDKLKIAFIPNYNVSVARIIVPAADLSEQISTAGEEASGTSNMKFALNGALTIGTQDGANVEIGEKVGRSNIFFFGRTKDDLTALQQNGYNPMDFIGSSDEHNPSRLRRALRFIQTETPYGSLTESVWSGDRWALATDFSDYWDKQEAARGLYLHDPESWLTKSIDNMRAGSRFSSDSTMREYAEAWGIQPFLAERFRPTQGPSRPVRTQTQELPALHT
ncbi:MAG: glycogen/starch/alpha-glucan family phosphorylase [Alphaproteobacteria bacterium]|nr:glycogen/starch/alpha-glucan family phosphorylase [Alphaproteobacteria bacterium]